MLLYLHLTPLLMTRIRPLGAQSLWLKVFCCVSVTFKLPLWLVELLRPVSVLRACFNVLHV